MDEKGSGDRGKFGEVRTNLQRFLLRRGEGGRSRHQGGNSPGDALDGVTLGSLPAVTSSSHEFHEDWGYEGPHGGRVTCTRLCVLCPFSIACLASKRMKV